MSDDPKPGDSLLAQLNALPSRRNAHDPAPAAREAFENAFVPWHQRVFSRASNVEVGADGTLTASLPTRLARGIVPLFLAGIVALYLLWALSAVLALRG